MNDSIVSQNYEIPNIDLKFAADGRLSRITARVLRSAGLRFCAKCQTVKEIGCFPNNYYWCIDCKRLYERGKDQSRYSESRAIIKRQLVMEFGKGQCLRCGFSEVIDALDFHHVDSAIKGDTISHMLSAGVDIETIRAEARKCVILCSNCHRGVHAGVYELPPIQMYLF